MSLRRFCVLAFGSAWLLTGCATYHHRSLAREEARQIERKLVVREHTLSPEAEDRILVLDPRHVTDQDVRELLVEAPAPRILNIHGGLFPIHGRMISFSRFLMGMGYPGSSITNPGDGTYTFSCYESSRKIAGVAAYYYEKEGMRPILVGHSQGGFQAVKVLYLLAGLTADNVVVWNPLTWEREERESITDPFTGQMRPVVGLRLPYVTAVNSGGIGRFLPNQWSMCGRLRKIPDSVEEFTGFHKGMDIAGGDFLGYGSANLYRANGHAEVRNVRLPTSYSHSYVPDTEHLLQSETIKDWINCYQPAEFVPPQPQLEGKTVNILWAAEVWYGIKKHWVLELQHLIRARRTQDYVL